MLLTLLREIEDQTVKLGSCLERGDTGQALTHHAEIRALIIEAAVVVLRTEGQQAEGALALSASPRAAAARARACTR
jgi:hypothetical protein